jgi:hypothetical protein
MKDLPWVVFAVSEDQTLERIGTLTATITQDACLQALIVFKGISKLAVCLRDKPTDIFLVDEYVNLDRVCIKRIKTAVCAWPPEVKSAYYNLVGK